MAPSGTGGEVQTGSVSDLASLLDEDGILKPDALAAPSAEQALLVFSQRPDARVELPLWQKNAESFFRTRLSSTVAKRYPRGFPSVDAVSIRVVADGIAEDAPRLCFGKPRTDAELRAAEDADTRAGGTGLGLLARRCPSVWVIPRNGEGDRAALLVAAILASVVLGPILTPEGELFGVKTARAKLDAGAGPYR